MLRRGKLACCFTLILIALVACQGGAAPLAATSTATVTALPAPSTPTAPLPTPTILPTENAPFPGFVADPNEACIFHRIGNIRDLGRGMSMMEYDPYLYALSCLDRDGWHIYEADLSADNTLAPTWLAALPKRPWSADINPLKFPNMVTQCPDGSLYLILDKKLFQLKNGKMIDITAKGYSIAQLIGSWADDFSSGGSLVCGPGSDILVSDRNNAEQKTYVSHYDGSTWVHYPVSGFEGSDQIFSMTVAPNGDFWVVGLALVESFNGSEWKTIGDRGTPLTIDPNGNVWVAEIYDNHVRVLKYDGSQWVTFSSSPDYFLLEQIAFDQKGLLWVTSSGYDLYTFDPQTDQWAHPFDHDLFSSKIKDMQFDRQGRLWVTTDYGLYVYDGTQWITYQMQNADLYSNSVYALLIFGNGPSLPAPAPKAPGAIAGQLDNWDPTTYSNKRVELCVGSFASGGIDVLGSSQYSGETPCASGPFHMLTSVGADGNFEFLNVPVGDYHIAIEISGTSWTAMGDFKVYPGTKTELGKIAYPPETGK